MKDGVEIGNRVLVFKSGFDNNGNWSYWVNSIRGYNDGQKPKKVNHSDALQGMSKVKDVKEFEKNKEAAEELSKYAMKYLKLSGMKEEEEEEVSESALEKLLKKHDNPLKESIESFGSDSTPSTLKSLLQ